MIRLAILLLVAMTPPVGSQPTATREGDASTGWRGNWTGMWPDAAPPLEWHRTPRSVANDLHTTVEPPTADSLKSATSLAGGLVREWLVLGPFPVKDAIANLDDLLIDEPKVQPAPNDAVGKLTWQRFVAPADDLNALGTAEVPWVNLATAVGSFEINQFAYALAYLHSPRGGTVRAVVDHSFGMKAWLNGAVVYREPKRQVVLGSYPNISRLELSDNLTASPRFDLKLVPGWNRLLLKIGSPPQKGFKDQSFLLRLIDLPDLEYDSKNIVWMSELPNRSSSTPILVGDRIFVNAEPDELLCLERASGRRLWSAFINPYEAIPPDERGAELRTKVEPLVEELRREEDRDKRILLRGRIKKVLLEVDPKRFTLPMDGHFAGHFGIVGFTVPAPISDGRHVYVWNGMGVAACFELDGRRRWITQIPGELAYASTPALVDGTFAVFMNRLYGLDAGTGKVRWQQKRITRNNAAVIPARIAGTPVIVTQRSDVVRARDGVILYRGSRDESSGDTGWAPPVVIGDIVYAPKFGVTHVSRLDFTGVEGETWEPKSTLYQLPPSVSRKPNGKWVDRWTAGSPVVLDDRAYQIDIWANAFAIDLKSKQMLYQQDTGLTGLFHYNALRVAASPTLIGKHLIVQDNQGTSLVLETGPTYRVVAKNRIATQLDRRLPLPAQEAIGYAPPLTDGQRLYLRGERYLYCIGTK
jgi:hypothetical protein